MKTLDKILIIIGAFLFLFIIAMIVIFCIYKAIPDTLVTCVLGSGLGEAIACAVITVFKKKYGGNDDETS